MPTQEFLLEVQIDHRHRAPQTDQANLQQDRLHLAAHVPTRHHLRVLRDHHRRCLQDLDPIHPVHRPQDRAVHTHQDLLVPLDRTHRVVPTHHHHLLQDHRVEDDNKNLIKRSTYSLN